MVRPVFLRNTDIRAEVRQLFLRQCGWDKATITPIAGDASFRRYFRLQREDGVRSVLMDAPPSEETTRPFVQVTGLLRASGLSAPALYAEDTETGFLLLEDLGDALFSRVLAEHPEQEETLYLQAVEVLARMQETRPLAQATLPPYTTPLWLEEIALFTRWFLPQSIGAEEAKQAEAALLALFETLLADIREVPYGLVLRDYHADNLIWLSKRKGTDRVGLLDYQDAVMGPVVYDLVSLLEDARRDVSPATEDAVQTRFLALYPELDAALLLHARAILGAQRNMKIIGIFHRLAQRDAKPRYLDYLPRVWGHLRRDLTHPALSPLAEWIKTHVPEDAMHSSSAVTEPAMEAHG